MNYRFGFNGKEKDNEIKGEGNSYDFGARIYDPRTGRWESLDPLFSHFPFISNYSFASNNPIQFIDYNGNFRMSPRLQRKYPQLTNILKNIKETVHNDPKTLEAFKQELHLTDDEVDAILTWGQGPKVVVGFTRLVSLLKGDNNGFFVNFSGSKKINRGIVGIRKDIIKDVEKKREYQENYDHPCLEAYKIILHEGQHKAEEFRPNQSNNGDEEYFTKKFEDRAWNTYSKEVDKLNEFNQSGKGSLSEQLHVFTTENLQKYEEDTQKETDTKEKTGKSR